MTAAADGGRAMKVVVLEPGYEDYATERRILSRWRAEVVPVPAGAPRAEVMAAIRDADAVMVREAPVDAELIAHMTRCRVVVRYGVGVDNIDLNAAAGRGIHVANTPNYGSREVASHAMALLLACARRVPTRDYAVRRGTFGVGQREKMYPLTGRVVGLVGLGAIAQAFLRMIRGFDPARVLVYNPFLDDARAREHDVEKADLETLCREATVISIHAPLTEQTRHLFGAEQFALMRPETILVNTARGPLVDEAALAQALREQRLFAAGIDVFEHEPPAADDPLFALENVVLSDHTGWYSEASVEELQTLGAEEVARVFSGQQPKSWVNRWEAAS